MLQASVIAALTSAFGDALTAFGGLRMTRLTVQAAAGATSITVERTSGLPVPGVIGIGNDRYSYTAISGLIISGLTYLASGVTHTGLVAAYATKAPVIDLSRTYSMLDKVKNGFFLNTASADDLTTIGRNLGVPRLPVIGSDTQYRALIKALAYAPRGTTYGLEMALDALIGAGTYKLHQTPSKPATVILTTDYESFNSGSVAGGSYIEGSTVFPYAVYAFSSSTMSALTPGAKQIRGLSLAPFSASFDFTSQIPDAYAPYLAYQLNSYSGFYLYGSGPNYVSRVDAMKGYFATGDYNLFLTPDSDFTVAARMTVRSSSGFTLGAPSKLFVMGAYDGTRGYGFSIEQSTTGVVLALCTVPAASIIASSDQINVAVGDNAYFDVKLSKNTARGRIKLTVGTQSVGAQVSQFPAATFGNGSACVFFGDLNNDASLGTGISIGMQNLYINTQTNRDYLVVQGTNASVSGNSATLPAYSATTNSNGKLVVLSGSAVNRNGGSNNGTYAITGVVASQAAPATVQLVQAGDTGASLTAAGVLTSPNRVFTYPQDLGKTVVVASGAAAGSYVISAIYDPNNSYANCATYALKPTIVSNQVLLATAPANAVSNVTYTIAPTFVAESNLTYLAGGNGVYGGAYSDTITLPGYGTYQVMADVTTGCEVAAVDGVTRPANADGTVDPALEFPIYLDEPLSEAEAYLSGLVAAGVVLEFDYTPSLPPVPVYTAPIAAPVNNN